MEMTQLKLTIILKVSHLYSIFKNSCQVNAAMFLNIISCFYSHLDNVLLTYEEFIYQMYNE